MQFPVLSAGACPMCAALHLWHNSCCRRTNEGWQTHLLHLWLERYAIIYPDKKPQIRINRWSQNETKLKQIVYIVCTHSPRTFPSAGVQSLHSQSVMMFIIHIWFHTSFGLGLVCVCVCVLLFCVFFLIACVLQQQLLLHLYQIFSFFIITKTFILPSDGDVLTGAAVNQTWSVSVFRACGPAYFSSFLWSILHEQRSK